MNTILTPRVTVDISRKWGLSRFAKTSREQTGERSTESAMNHIEFVRPNGSLPRFAAL